MIFSDESGYEQPSSNRAPLAIATNDGSFTKGKAKDTTGSIAVQEK
jgi:hypothetical protein